jgi:hypothetical protein
MAIGTPANTLAGATVNATTQALSIPVVAAGRVLLITSHARRASASLAPDNPTIADSSAAPLTWTPVYATPPVMVGVNPGTKAQWWWAIADGAAKTVTLTWLNAASIWASVADFSTGATPNFLNQAWAASSGTPSGAVTATFPINPTTGINFLSFYGAGGSTSTIATGYTSLTNVASTPYRTGYDITPGPNAVMGAGFLDQILCAVNITDVISGPQGAKNKVWSGSAWVEKPMARWDGSAWVQEAPKVWSGTAWVSSAMPPWTPPATGPTSKILTAFTPGTDRNDFTGEVGVRLGISTSNITFTWMGARRHHAGQTGSITVNLYEWFADTLVRSASINLGSVAVGSWAWTAVPSTTMLANGYYALLMGVTASDGQVWCNPGACTFTGMTNIYDCYRVPASALATGTQNDMFNGLDLGW